MTLANTASRQFMTIKIKTPFASSAPAESAKPLVVAPPKPRPQPKWLALVFRTARPAAAASRDVKTEEKFGADALLAFGAERDQAVVAPPSKPAQTTPAPRLRFSRASGIAVAVIGFGLAVLVLVRVWMPLSAAAPAPAKLRVETRPAGAEVLVDGVARGITPLTMTLAAGEHRIILRRGTDDRVVPVTLTPGAEVTQYLELAQAETSTGRTGTINVMTDRPGARVLIDGEPVGVSPLIFTNATPTDHKVAVNTVAGSAERTVSVQADATTTVVFTLPKAAGPIVGWIAVSAPFDVQVIERDAVIGTGKTARIMLTAGRHEIALSNGQLGYQEKRIVDVGAGKATTIRVDAPKRTISANARPWADVFIDAVSVGQTPISNLPVTIGPHDIVFRHPQLGEQKQTLIVTLQGPNRIAADLTKK
jgi:PEGA domain